MGFGEEIEPSPGDYILSDSGPLGSKTSVSVHEEGFLDEFDTEEEAEAFIVDRMESERFWPSVWYVDDHGGIRPHNISGPPGKELTEEGLLAVLRSRSIRMDRKWKAYFYEDIVKAAAKKGYSKYEVERVTNLMLERGSMYEPALGYLRIVKE